MNSEVQQYAINFSHTIHMRASGELFIFSLPFITFSMIADNEKAERKEAHRIHIAVKLNKVFVTFMCFKKGSLECQFFLLKIASFCNCSKWKTERVVKSTGNS